jgi:hypothetical protein
MQHHTALAGLAMLKANIIRERLSEFSVTSGTAWENDMSSEQETEEIVLTGNHEFGNETGELDLQIPLGDSIVPYSADQIIPEGIGYIKLSLSEILRLIGIVNAKISEAKMAFHISWSKWRRKHQAIARWYRMQRGMKAEQRALINPAFAGAATLCNRNRGRSSSAGSHAPPASATTQLRSVKAEL